MLPMGVGPLTRLLTLHRKLFKGSWDTVFLDSPEKGSDGRLRESIVDCTVWTPSSRFCTEGTWFQDDANADRLYRWHLTNTLDWFLTIVFTNLRRPFTDLVSKKYHSVSVLRKGNEESWLHDDRILHCNITSTSRNHFRIGITIMFLTKSYIRFQNMLIT